MLSSLVVWRRLKFMFFGEDKIVQRLFTFVQRLAAWKWEKDTYSTQFNLKESLMAQE